MSRQARDNHKEIVARVLVSFSSFAETGSGQNIRKLKTTLVAGGSGPACAESVPATRRQHGQLKAAVVIPYTGNAKREPPRENGTFFIVFPMFVPSLSW
eukprot:COSAG06_NODE_4747_length_3986_cov_6.589658_4_plen_99_part_00